MIYQTRFSSFTIFVFLFSLILLASLMLSPEAYAQIANPPFSIASQPYVFDPDANFGDMDVDGFVFQAQTVKDLVNEAVDHISSNTIMTFTEIPFISNTGVIIGTDDTLDPEFSAQVNISVDFNSGIEIKFFDFNTNLIYLA